MKLGLVGEEVYSEAKELLPKYSVISVVHNNAAWLATEQSILADLELELDLDCTVLVEFE